VRTGPISQRQILSAGDTAPFTAVNGTRESTVSAPPRQPDIGPHLPETHLASVKCSISAFGKTSAVEVVVFAKNRQPGGFLQP
jgi:hypothetical protein